MQTQFVLNLEMQKVVNGSVISATGVSGVRYKRQIELSTTLTPLEKSQRSFSIKWHA